MSRPLLKGLTHSVVVSANKDIVISGQWGWSEERPCESPTSSLTIRLLSSESPSSIVAEQTEVGLAGGGSYSFTFTNLVNGEYWWQILVRCGDVLHFTRIYGSRTVTQGIPVDTPPSDPTTNPVPGSGGTTNPNTNSPDFCIPTGAINLSASGLNLLFGRPSNYPNTLGSGPFNPSRPPSLFGVSWLPNNVVTPGKLRQNAISEFRGTCIMGNAADYQLIILQGDVTFNFIDSSNIVISLFYYFNWLHVPSGIITERSPWGNSSINGSIVMQTINRYQGISPPSPQRITAFRNNTELATISRSLTVAGQSTLPYSTGNINRGDTVSFRIDSQEEGFDPSAGTNFRVSFRMSNSAATIAGASVASGRLAATEEFIVNRDGPPIVNPTVNWTAAARTGQSGTLTITGVSPSVSRSVTSGQTFTGTSTGTAGSAIIASFNSNTGPAQLLISRSSPSFMNIFSYSGPNSNVSHSFTPEQGATYQITGRALQPGEGDT